MEMRRYHRVLRSVAAPALLLLLLLTLVLPFIQTQMQSAREKAADELPLDGGIVDTPGAENDLRIVDLARFAVSEHKNRTVSPPSSPVQSVCLCSTPSRTVRSTQVLPCVGVLLHRSMLNLTAANTTRGTTQLHLEIDAWKWRFLLFSGTNFSCRTHCWSSRKW
ncbi:hypothetical protein VPH35_101158 [Triticum aestivum]